MTVHFGPAKGVEHRSDVNWAVGDQGRIQWRARTMRFHQFFKLVFLFLAPLSRLTRGLGNQSGSVVKKTNKQKKQ